MWQGQSGHRGAVDVKGSIEVVEDGGMKRVILIAAVVALCCTPSVAHAVTPPDSDAPPGADAMWLPEEEWVMERWMPFDEDRLVARIGMSHVTLYTRLKQGNRSIADIARGRRVSLTAEFLVQPLRKRTSEANWRTLRDRARRVLTQRHLAEHLIGHQYHHWAIWKDPTKIWGTEFKVLRDQGLDAPAISARVGPSREVLARRILAALEATGQRGVSVGSLTHRQARLLRDRHRANISEIVGTAVIPRRTRLRRVVTPDSSYLLCALRSTAR